MTLWRIEPLSASHERGAFDCGEGSLNVFLRLYAAQNARRDISRTYVSVAPETSLVTGYYTLCSGSVSFEAIPENAARRLPHYPVPVAHLARLAVDKRFQGQGLGGFLLLHAMRLARSVADQIGVHAVTVRAMNDGARSFYERFGFLPLRDDRLHLYLPMATVRLF